MTYADLEPFQGVKSGDITLISGKWLELLFSFLATRLLKSKPEGPLRFLEERYCSVVPESTPLNTKIATVEAVHEKGKLFVLFDETGTKTISSWLMRLSLCHLGGYCAGEALVFDSWR